MKTIRDLLHTRGRRALISAVALVALLMATGTNVVAEEKATETTAQRDQSTGWMH
jgi:hypothetical protein